jgi:diadenosine tetraphosphate (Ap4A) HIT family hydrolase
VLAENDFAFLIRDGYPVSDGHSLVISKRHVGSFFETTSDERDALLDLVDQAKLLIEKKFQPSAYNVGINDGAAAGQTVPHLHIHLIPRYAADDADPRGGVRWVVPERADYWSQQ